jgi:hypothetical protein
MERRDSLEAIRVEGEVGHGRSQLKMLAEGGVMPNPRPFDGHVEQTLRVPSTSLIHFQRNRYSVH